MDNKKYKRENELNVAKHSMKCYSRDLLSNRFKKKEEVMNKYKLSYECMLIS